MRGIPGSGRSESRMPTFEEHGSAECQGVRIVLALCSFPVGLSLFAHRRARHPACQAFMQETGQCINVQDFRELFAKQNWLATINQ
jgi:hypothetical protein